MRLHQNYLNHLFSVSYMIKLICVGRLKDPFITGLIDEYLKRTQRFAKIEIVEVEDQKIENVGSDKAAELLKEMEARRIVKILEASSRQQYIIMLDENGTLFSSEQLAERIQQREVESDIVFIIGGALGLAGELRKKGNLVMSLSRMTLTHGFARLFLIEQVYRAYTIMKGMPYHK